MYQTPFSVIQFKLKVIKAHLICIKLRLAKATEIEKSSSLGLKKIPFAGVHLTRPNTEVLTMVNTCLKISKQH